MQVLPSILWNKNSKTKLCHNSKPSSRSSLKTKMNMNPKRKRMKSSKVKNSQKNNQIRMMKTRETGDLRTSWSEESISWRKKRKLQMINKAKMRKIKIKKTVKLPWENSHMQMKRRRNVSTWSNTIRKKSKSSQSRKPKPRSETSSTPSTSWPPVTNVKNILTTWTKSLPSQRSTKTLKSFLSCLLIFPSELKFSDKWSWPTSAKINGVQFTTTLTLFTTSWRNLKRKICWIMSSSSAKTVTKRLPQSRSKLFTSPFKPTWLSWKLNWENLSFSSTKAMFNTQKDFKTWSNLLNSCTKSQETWASTKIWKKKAFNLLSKFSKTCISWALSLWTS